MQPWSWVLAEPFAQGGKTHLPEIRNQVILLLKKKKSRSGITKIANFPLMATVKLCHQKENKLTLRKFFTSPVFMIDLKILGFITEDRLEAVGWKELGRCRGSTLYFLGDKGWTLSQLPTLEGIFPLWTSCLSLGDRASLCSKHHHHMCALWQLGFKKSHKQKGL